MTARKPIAEWVEMKGYSCAQCGDVARQNPDDAGEWGCAKCDGASHSLVLNFLRNGDLMTRVPRNSAQLPSLQVPDDFFLTRERLDWLRLLVSEYRNEHDWQNDVDPEATDEMLDACTALADQVERTILPEPPAQHVCANPADQEAYDREIPF